MQHGKTNLTITVDEAALKKARIRAINEGTSINEMLGKFLESYAGVQAGQRAAINRLLEMSRRSRAKRAPGQRWSREDLYKRK